MSRFPIVKKVTAAMLLGGVLAAPSIQAADALDGKQLAFDVKKGNCLACHSIPGGESPGTIAPPLMAMQSRFPEKAKLREQIWDSTARNPESAMPPFGKYGVLSAAEIDAITDFIWTQ